MKKLDNIENNNPFTMPENYFNSFSQDVETKISEQNVEDFFGKEKPFSLPENYFRNSENDIKDKIFPLEKVKMRSILKPYLAIAASFLFIFTVWQFVAGNFRNDSDIQISENKITKNNVVENITISIDSIFADKKITEEIIEEYIDTYEEETLIAEVTEEKSDTEIEENKIESLDLNEEDMTNYIADNYDYSEIIDDL